MYYIWIDLFVTAYSDRCITSRFGYIRTQTCDILFLNDLLTAIMSRNLSVIYEPDHFWPSGELLVFGISCESYLCPCKHKQVISTWMERAAKIRW